MIFICSFLHGDSRAVEDDCLAVVVRMELFNGNIVHLSLGEAFRLQLVFGFYDYGCKRRAFDCYDILHTAFPLFPMVLLYDAFIEHVEKIQQKEANLMPLL